MSRATAAGLGAAVGAELPAGTPRQQRSNLEQLQSTSASCVMSQQTLHYM